MRTTLDIDDDVLAAAKELARAEGKTMGEVVSELARRALTGPQAVNPSGFSDVQTRFIADDWPTFPRHGGAPVTSELIQQIQDEIDLEDATPFHHALGKPRVFEPPRGRKSHIP